MELNFECNTCSACGCGVSLYNRIGQLITRSSFESNSQKLYCRSHIPQMISTTKTDDQVLTVEQKINYLNNS